MCFCADYVIVFAASSLKKITLENVLKWEKLVAPRSFSRIPSEFVMAFVSLENWRHV